MAQDKKAFLIYSDWNKMFNALPDEVAGKLIKHILSYVNDENPSSDDYVINALFEQIKSVIERDCQKYEETITNRSYAGKLGNLKRWHEELYMQVINNQLTIDEAVVIANNRKLSQSDTEQSVAIAKIADKDKDNRYSNIDSNKEYMSNQKSLSDKSDVDYPDLFKKYIDYYNKTFSKNFTTKGWEKKAYSKFKQAHSSYKENFGKHLVIVCDNIKKDDFHKEKEFKFATPEYILRPEVFERFLNAKPQIQKWNSPSEIYMCVDWIKRIPQPPKVDTPEYYRFIEEWKISDLKSYQVNKTGSYTNLDEYGK
jgi:hypothetical protein